MCGEGKGKREGAVKRAGKGMEGRREGRGGEAWEGGNGRGRKERERRCVPPLFL
jgi:hypothetical protein